MASSCSATISMEGTGLRAGLRDENEGDEHSFIQESRAWREEKCSHTARASRTRDTSLQAVAQGEAQAQRAAPPPAPPHVVWRLAPHFAGWARGEVYYVYKVHTVAIIPRGLSTHPLLFLPKPGFLQPGSCSTLDEPKPRRQWGRADVTLG